MDNKIKRLYEISEGKGSNILKQFAKSDKYRQLIINTLENPSEKNIKRLDIAFREFFYEIKLTKYMLTLIKNYSIQSIKKYRSHFEKHLYILDRNSGENEDDISLIDYISQDHNTPEKLYEVHITSILECIENPNLYFAAKKLSQKQLNILYLIYFKKYKIKDISKIYGESEQNISKMHKNTLLKLYKEVVNDAR